MDKAKENNSSLNNNGLMAIVPLITLYCSQRSKLNLMLPNLWGDLL